MPAKPAGGKVECLNPNTGSRMNIDKSIYDLISTAIYHSLKTKKVLGFTEMLDGIDDCLEKDKIKFSGSVGWYAMTVKNDMQARGIIEVFTEKGRKMHRLKK